MNERTDQELLRDYSGRRAEGAFEEIVRRHVDLVYSAALRTTRDRHRAEDVTQAVFVALARNAASLADRPVLAGWLYRTAHHIGAQTVRTEVRRRAREQEVAVMDESNPDAPDGEAWERISFELDEALAGLAEPDREAVLLRYFQRQSARDMARALGTSEEAAQKRVSRAVGRLRDALANRGLSIGAGGLAAGLSAHAVQTAPPALAATIAAAAVTAITQTGVLSASVGTLTTTTPPALVMITVQKVLVAALLVALAGTALVQTRRASALRAESEALRAQQSAAVAEIARLSLEHEQLQAESARDSNRLAEARQQHTELLRLRGEVGVLRDQKRELARLAAVATAKPGAARTTAVSAVPTAPPPFQLRLVVDDDVEGAETLPFGDEVAAGGPVEKVRVDKAPLLDHTTIQSANVVMDPLSGSPQIEVQFTDKGREEFARVTRENLNRRIAIALDGRLYGTPVIRSEITGGKAMVTGRFTEAQAWELAAKINLALTGR